MSLSRGEEDGGYGHPASMSVDGALWAASIMVNGLILDTAQCNQGDIGIDNARDPSSELFTPVCMSRGLS